MQDIAAFTVVAFMQLLSYACTGQLTACYVTCS